MRKTFIVGAISAGLLGVVGIAGAAYATLDKSVTLTVDGKSREVHSFGSTVGDILAAENLKVGERDVVSPGRAAAIQDGTEIAVRYARPVRLTIDGRTSERWVTARTVGEALHQLNVRHPDVKVSVSRSKRIGRAGLAFDVRTPKDFTVVHDGRRTRMTAPVLTVGEALSAAEVGVDADDRLRPGLSTFVESGATIEIQRIDERRENVRRKLDYDTIRRASSDLYEGTSKVTREGRTGLEARVLEVLYVDGKKKSSKVLSRRIVREPVDRVVTYGTKERSSGGGGSVGGGVDDLNWEALAQCESSGNPRAVNPNGHYGLYQFSLSTWRSVGGTGNPIDASPAEQTYRAKLLYKRAGAGQWTCGHHLFD